MFNRFLINTLSKAAARFPQPARAVSYRFSTQKRNEDNEDDMDKQYQYEEEPKGSRNTRGWWIYRGFIYGTFALFAHQAYNIAYGEKPKIVKKVDESGNVATEKVYSFRTIPGFYYMADGFVHYVKKITNNLVNPPVKKLLPTPLHPLMHPKTLVFDLTGTVVFSQYIIGKGRKLTIRPGLLKALDKLSKQYEIVFWGDDDAHSMQQTLMKMGLPEMAQMSFGRECLSWTWEDGFQRNLKYLNRDLKNVIVVDNKGTLCKHYPNNVIQISEFKGDVHDSEIQTLVQILDRMKGPNITDVRTVIEKLGDNPIQKFREVGSKVKEEQAEMDKKRKYWSGKLGK